MSGLNARILALNYLTGSDIKPCKGFPVYWEASLKGLILSNYLYRGNKMKQTITESYFIDQLVGDEYNNMSYEGAKALFNWFEEFESDLGEEQEFDKVSIRCEFAEYDSIADVLSEYDSIDSLEDLRDNTTVIEVPDSEKLIIQQF